MTLANDTAAFATCSAAFFLSLSPLLSLLYRPHLSLTYLQRRAAGANRLLINKPRLQICDIVKCTK